MQRITSRQNARVKQAAKLRGRRGRERQQRFVIDGRREIARAIDAGVEIVEAYVHAEVVDKGPLAGEVRQLVESLEHRGAEASLVSDDVYEKLCFGGRNEGVVAVGRTPSRSLDCLTLSERPLIAVIEGVEKPGNIGAVLRCADGAGVDAVVVANPQTDLFNPNTIRASLGTVFAGFVCTASSADTRCWLRQLNIPMYAARPDAKRLYTEADFCCPVAVILGSEAAGVSDVWLSKDVAAIRLPMLGAADSLNISAAAAVVFYEARRQRDLHGP